MSYEQVVKSPETVVETEAETDLRIKAEQMYYNSGGGLIGDYEAGWKAAKAYYEVKE